MLTSPFSASLPVDISLLRLLIIAILLVAICMPIGRRLLRRSLYEHLPGPPSSKLGYLIDMHDPTALDWHFKMANKYGHVVRLKGNFITSDGLYISDPLALHSILVKDQGNFRESTEFSGLFGVIHHGDGLASVWGQEHKRQRKLMNPVFTASHVSKLTPLFYNIAYELRARLKEEVLGQPVDNTIDVLDRLTRTALELISQGGIGHTFHSFDKDSKEFKRFHKALKTVLPMAGRLFMILPYLEGWRKIKPIWLRRLLANTVYYLPWPSARKFKDAVDTMHPVCASVFQSKKILFAEGGMEALEKTTSGGKDLTTLLMQANSEADEDDRMPDKIVIANMSSIVLGGQETTSGALSRLLSLMTQKKDLQARLREEIVQAKQEKNGEDLDYNELNNLPLLDAVCRETLRLFAPVTFVWRQTIEDIVVPLYFPTRDPRTGVEHKKLLIKKGTSVYVGIGAANQSAAIWGPDAGQFKPERWLGKSGVETTTEGIKVPGIYSNVMTFLGGGRSCPGMKFALSEIKLVLSVLLPTFSFAAGPDKIDWRMGITLSPYVRGKENEGPKAPMRVSLVDKAQ